MHTESLLERTLRLLKSTNLKQPQIATGADVSPHWLAKFSQGLIPEPGVSKVQRVHDFLSSYEAIRAPRSSQQDAA